MADPMGLAAGYGAGTVSGSLDELLRRRLLEQEQARLERAQRAQEAQFAASLAEQQAGRVQQGAQFGQTHGLARERFGKVEVPESKANIGLTQERTEGERWGNKDRQRIDDVRQRGMADWGALTPGERVLGFGVGEETPGAVRTADQQAALERIRVAEAGRRATARETGGFGRPSLQRFTTTDPETGRKIEKMIQVFPDGTTSDVMDWASAPTADMENRTAFMDQAQVSLGLLGELSKQVNTETGWKQLVVGGVRTAKGMLQEDEVVKMYTDIRQGLAMTMARALGSNSQLSDGERKAAAGMLPGVFDNKGLAERKQAFWHTLIEKARRRGIIDPETGQVTAAEDDVRAALRGAGLEAPTDPAPIGTGQATPPQDGDTHPNDPSYVWRDRGPSGRRGWHHISEGGDAGAIR